MASIPPVSSSSSSTRTNDSEKRNRLIGTEEKLGDDVEPIPAKDVELAAGLRADSVFRNTFHEMMFICLITSAQFFTVSLDFHFYEPTLLMILASESRQRYLPSRAHLRRPLRSNHCPRFLVRSLLLLRRRVGCPHLRPPRRHLWPSKDILSRLLLALHILTHNRFHAE